MLLLQCSGCAFVLLYRLVIPTPNAAEESATFDRLVIPTPNPAEESAMPRFRASLHLEASSESARRESSSVDLWIFPTTVFSLP
jgi:hypothetical protein